MKDGSSVPIKFTKPSSSGGYSITGRVRGEDNLSVMGLVVQAFDKDPGIYLHPDDSLGSAVTDENGAFEITFEEERFDDWFEGGPEVYLVLRDQSKKVLVRTEAKENTTGLIDFQIKLGRSKADPAEPDLYSSNLPRLISAFNTLFDLDSLSNSDARTVVEVLFRAVNSWVLYRDDLVRYAGYDGIQVPSHPRWREHYHVTRWDKPILPVEDQMQ